MKINKNILCINADLESTNLGCAALGISFVQMIKEIAHTQSLHVVLNIIGYGKGKEYKDEDIEIHKPVYFDSRRREFWKFLNQSVDRADLIIDFTGGDSFTDIYGLRRFIRESIVKEKAIKSTAHFVLGPQTIGPFKNHLVKMIAKHLILSSDYVFARDEISCNYAKGLGCNCILTTDVAFMLQPTSGKFDNLESSSRKKIGINISGLLINGGYSSNNQFGLKMNYKVFVNELVKKAIKLDFETHLISHVLPLRSPAEDDYKAAEVVHSEFPETILAPRFSSPKEAKEYISHMDFFVGSRMHATIAAFSMGVPTIPVAYSPKFSRLFSSVGYNRVIDGKDTDETEAIKFIDDCIENEDKLKREINTSMSIIRERNTEFKGKIEEILAK